MKSSKLWIWLFCTLIAIWQYTTITLATCPNCNSIMADIASGKGEAPFAYRLLTPLILMAMGNTPQALVLFHLIGFGVFLALIGLWASKWHKDPMLTITLAALALIVMFPNWYFSAYSLTEWNLLITGLLLLQPFSQSAHSIGR